MWSVARYAYRPDGHRRAPGKNTRNATTRTTGRRVEPARLAREHRCGDAAHTNIGGPRKQGGGVACRQGGPTVTAAHRSPSRAPYRLIVSDDPCRTLAQGEMRYFATMLAAANAFVKAEQPYMQIVYDDGCSARHLNGDEQRLLENVCAKLGYDVEEVGA